MNLYCNTTDHSIIIGNNLALLSDETIYLSCSIRAEDSWNVPKCESKKMGFTKLIF